MLFAAGRNLSTPFLLAVQAPPIPFRKEGMGNNDIAAALSNIGRGLLVAWILWMSKGFVEMKSDISLLKYAVFKTIAKDETIPQVEQDAGATIWPLPPIERKK